MIDISRSINKRIKVYSGDPKFNAKEVYSIEKGDEYNVSEITMGSHMSTHIDSPKHFFEDGVSVDMLDINSICGKAVVVTAEKDVDSRFLRTVDISCGRVIIRTGGKYGMTKCGAEYLAQNGIKIVGTDGMDIEAEGNKYYEAHKALLGNGAPILEYLDLEDVADGEYILYCLPLKVEGLDAVPVRAVLEVIL